MIMISTCSQELLEVLIQCQWSSSSVSAAVHLCKGESLALESTVPNDLNTKGVGPKSS